MRVILSALLAVLVCLIVEAHVTDELLEDSAKAIAKNKDAALKAATDKDSIREVNRGLNKAKNELKKTARKAENLVKKKARENERDAKKAKNDARRELTAYEREKARAFRYAEREINKAVKEGRVAIETSKNAGKADQAKQVEKELKEIQAAFEKTKAAAGIKNDD